jgi:hypothetical protein
MYEKYIREFNLIIGEMNTFGFQGSASSYTAPNFLNSASIEKGTIPNKPTCVSSTSLCVRFYYWLRS